MTLHGVYTIALTPFTDEGDLDEESIGPLSEFYVDADVHGLTILGIMGEAHKLSDAERRMVVERYVSTIGGRVPVVVGCSAVATKVVVERARAAEEAGAAATSSWRRPRRPSRSRVSSRERRARSASSVVLVGCTSTRSLRAARPAP
jgi:4-hydroxy-tetrahydrodipicolinate synthase